MDDLLELIKELKKESGPMKIKYWPKHAVNISSYEAKAGKEQEKAVENEIYHLLTMKKWLEDSHHVRSINPFRSRYWADDNYRKITETINLIAGIINHSHIKGVISDERA